eukprot:15406053-Alexandrium_andersonii.AAC.1
MVAPPQRDEAFRREIARVVARWRAHHTAEEVVPDWEGASRCPRPLAAYDDRSEPYLRCPVRGKL